MRWRGNAQCFTLRKGRLVHDGGCCGPPRTSWVKTSPPAAGQAVLPRRGKLETTFKGRFACLLCARGLGHSFHVLPFPGIPTAPGPRRGRSISRRCRAVILGQTPPLPGTPGVRVIKVKMRALEIVLSPLPCRAGCWGWPCSPPRRSNLPRAPTPRTGRCTSPPQPWSARGARLRPWCPHG